MMFDSKTRQRENSEDDEIKAKLITSSPMNEIETSDMTSDDDSLASSDEMDATELEQADSNVNDHDGQTSLHSGKTSKTMATSSTSNSYSATNVDQRICHDAHPPRSFIPMHSVDTGSFGEFDIPGPEPLVLLGCDITHLSPNTQFIICASGVFGFSLLYGFLQELLAVQICNRRLGLFLSMLQFTGYTILSYILRTHANKAQQHKLQKQLSTDTPKISTRAAAAVPLITYLGLSLLRAVDLAMTNMAMQYINYPAKTLMKSSRVVFTMIFGMFILRKKYMCVDYFIVLCMVAGLAIFMHADATSSAVFQPLGVIMLTISLLCDGAITNMSETIMTKYDVGQDEFIFRMYSIALVAITAAAAIQGDLQVGMEWLVQPGTYDEVQQGVPAEETSWSVVGKISIIVMFSSMGLLSSSCSAAITKHFGALAMSITSTARKATTVFLSFLLFNNVCTTEHIAGVAIFIAALTVKSLRRRKESYELSSSMVDNILDAEVVNRVRDNLHITPIEDRTPLMSSTTTPARLRRPASALKKQAIMDIESQNETHGKMERGISVNAVTMPGSSHLHSSNEDQRFCLESDTLNNKNAHGAQQRIKRSNSREPPHGTIGRVNDAGKDC